MFCILGYESTKEPKGNANDGSTNGNDKEGTKSCGDVSCYDILLTYLNESFHHVIQNLQNKNKFCLLEYHNLPTCTCTCNDFIKVTYMFGNTEKLIQLYTKTNYQQSSSRKTVKIKENKGWCHDLYIFSLRGKLLFSNDRSINEDLCKEKQQIV